MADDAPFPEQDDARPGPGSASWEPYQSPQGGRGGALRLLRRYAFSITAGAAALAIGLLIYFAPTRLAPDPSTPPPPDDGPASTLSVYSEPTGAVVIVGADTAGVTPINRHRLSPGTYLVTVDRENYGSRDTVLTLSAGQSATLQPRFARSESSLGAQGQTATAPRGGGPPSSRSAGEPAPDDPAPSSSPTPRASSNETPGASPDRPAADGRSEASPSPTSSDVAPVTGTLVLRATPERTTVALDGDEVGTTPITLDPVETGTYSVTFSRSDYDPLTRRVDVSASDTATVTATLAPQAGHLRVLVRPWGSIYIDDERRAENSDVWYDTSLPAGEHTVTARHPALGETSRSVTVAPRDTQSVVVDLREQ